MVILYLDPGSGSFLIQLIMSGAVCLIPLAIITATVVFILNLRKRHGKDKRDS